MDCQMSPPNHTTSNAESLSREVSTHLWLVLFKAHQAIRTLDEQSIASSGLCFSDFAVLEVLLHKGALPVNIIGEKILLTSGSITTAIDRLEKKSLVERQSSTTDKRVRLVHLTKSGRTLIESFFEKHQESLERAMGGLNLEEKQILIPLLKKLGKHAKDLL
jgi:MarR family transcriptional regulator, 2-MHQ and catechol-resistance regulon repressor